MMAPSSGMLLSLMRKEAKLPTQKWKIRHSHSVQSVNNSATIFIVKLQRKAVEMSPFHSLFLFKIIHTNAYSHKHIFFRLSFF